MPRLLVRVPLWCNGSTSAFGAVRSGFESWRRSSVDAGGPFGEPLVDGGYGLSLAMDAVVVPDLRCGVLVRCAGDRVEGGDPGGPSDRGVGPRPEEQGEAKGGGTLVVGTDPFGRAGRG